MNRKLQQALLFIILVELFIGGNGYLIEIGGARIRVWLAITCLTWVVVSLLSSSFKPAKNIWILLTLFFGTTLIGALTGLIGGINFISIFAELKGLLYFPMIMFFSFVIREKEDVELVARLIINCAILQALIFVGIIILMHAGILEHQAVYKFLIQSDEFIFRHERGETFYIGFFYKGAFHLGTAALFLLFVPKYRNYAIAGLIFVAIIFTETRGLLMAFCLTSFIGALAMRRINSYLILLIIMLFAALILLSTDSFSLLSRPKSDNVRIENFTWIIANFNPERILVGHGMGAHIGERNRIEMTYLEIFYKQGILGLLPWIALYIVNLLTCISIRGNEAKFALAFHLSTLYVYLATATNTFLTGSIGMSIVLLSTVSLNVLYKSQKHMQTLRITNA